MGDNKEWDLTECPPDKPEQENLGVRLPAKGSSDTLEPTPLLKPEEGQQIPDMDSSIKRYMALTPED